MEPSEFAQWRSQMGLTKKEAGLELGVSALTISLYEQGFRYDDKRPVAIPKSIELACEALRLRKIALLSSPQHDKQSPPAAQEEHDLERLNWNDVPEPLLTEAYAKLRERGVPLSQHPFPATLDWLGAAWGGLDKWFRDNHVRGLAVHVFPNDAAPGGGVAILDLAHPDDAFAFKLRWY